MTEHLPQLPADFGSSKTFRPDGSGKSICTVCGLCCDGTLFLRVPLRSDDQAGELSAFGIEIISDQNNGSAIKQPCASHKNHLCSIYADRPRSCRAFQCKLLKRFTANETSEAEALAIIRQAVAYRDRVRQVMSRVFGGNACTFDDFTLRLRANWKNAASFEEKERVSELFSAFAQLWWNINKYFHDRWLR